MAKESVLTIKLETELRVAFMAEAKLVHRPASQLIRDFMWAFVEQRREANPNRKPLSVHPPLQPIEPAEEARTADPVEVPPAGDKGKGSRVNITRTQVFPPAPPSARHTVVADEPRLLIDRILGSR